jgi:hypothetical protein
MIFHVYELHPNWKASNVSIGWFINTYDELFLNIFLANRNDIEQCYWSEDDQFIMFSCWEEYQSKQYICSREDLQDHTKMEWCFSYEYGSFISITKKDGTMLDVKMEKR